METDAELHVYRLAELARLVGGGELYPRWAPNFYFGYGYPIFNYYAPLAYYLGLPLALIPTAGAVLGVKFVFILAYVLGAAGIYGFVSDFWGRQAALVSAAAYMFAPYLQYVDPHARGDLAEFLSFGLFPLALWVFSRLFRTGSASSFLAAIVATGLVILSHNLMAIVFFALLCAWVFWQIGASLLRHRESGATGGDEGDRRAFRLRIIAVIAALVLGVAIAAFFWLPVALERDAVNLRSVIGAGGHFDFRNHFLSLGEMLGPTGWLDWGATEPAFARNLGIAQWLLALLGVAGLMTGCARHRMQAAFFAVSAAVLAFLMTPASSVIWETVPLMPYLQFPWRLLGPAAGMLAILGGVAVQSASSCLGQWAWRATANRAVERGTNRLRLTQLALGASRWFPAFVILIILLQALPLSMVPPWPETPWDTSAATVMAIERRGKWLGTTSTADFVPRSVEILPRPQDQMVDQFIAGGPLDRVNRTTLPQGTTLESESLTPLHTRYWVSSEDPFLLRLFQFSFPGWQARVDGSIVETTLGRPEGFIVVPVPAGEHVVDVDFVETDERRLAWLISAAAVVLSVASAALIARNGWRHGAVRDGSTAAPRSLRPMLLTGVLFVVAFSLAQWQSWFHYESTGWTAIPAEHDTYADLGGQLALIGYDYPVQVAPGEAVEVTLYWKAQTEIEINFQVFLHLLDSSGHPVAQSDKLNPGDYPAKRWTTAKYVRDSHRLEIPESLAPGTYALSTGMWVQSEGWRLPYLDENGEQIGDSVGLGTIEVR